MYRRRSQVIYPPVRIEGVLTETRPVEERNYFLSLGRLVPYKRVDLLVEAFRACPHLELRVVGDGPERERLARNLPPNVQFLGRLPGAQVLHLLRQAKALVFAAEEDFGLAPVEAQGVGTPVIAYARGGASESVLPGKTGVLFGSQTVPALLSAFEEFAQTQFEPSVLVANARRFGLSVFRRTFLEWVCTEWSGFQKRK